MEGGNTRIAVLCPAKLNLHLEVLGKRDDGYHEVRLLNTAITLFDRIEIETDDRSGVRIFCGHPQVPLGEDNLCARAARLFFDTFPDKERGLKIWIDKKIPVAAGLGGGSSDAAGVLFALNRLFDFPAGKEELVNLSSRLGSDVPFFLFRSPAWALGRGELLTEASPLPDFTYLVIAFPFGIFAADSYAAWDLTNPRKQDNLRHPERGYFPAMPEQFRNDLEPSVLSRCPEVARIKDSLGGPGLLGAMMSGSGPSVFGVFENDVRAREAAEQLEKSAGLSIFLTRAITGEIISLAG